MSEPPESGPSDPSDEPPRPPGGGPPTGPPPPGYGQVPPPGYPQQPYGYIPPGAPGAWGANPQAPYGYDPRSGLPYSDKQKLVSGLLQILVPLGIGRMYTGHVALGVGQLVVSILTCGIGTLWPFIDGIVILAGDPKDAAGRPLRP
jgi:TM2 domain-containing membrane protein YozV